MNVKQTSKKKKMLYICPVDWMWIKQRPHFLAECLQKDADLFILFPHQNRREGLRQEDDDPGLRKKAYYLIPSLGGKIRFLKRLADRFAALQIKRALKKEKPDLIWLSYPNQFDLLPAGNRIPLVYDCMDDYASIAPNQAISEAYQASEKKLLAAAQTVFCSSEHLAGLLRKRLPACAEKITLLRNGYGGGWKALPKEEGAAEKTALTYVGTVGRWFDRELLARSLDRFPMLEYHIYGPCEPGCELPSHPRLFYHGTAEHSRIPELTRNTDAYIMPFMRCDIVESVDPVKLYEYIALERPALSVDYPEVRHFAPFVYFYDSDEAYFAYIEALAAGRLKTEPAPERERFLAENTWSARAALAARVLGLNDKG